MIDKCNLRFIEFTLCLHTFLKIKIGTYKIDTLYLLGNRKTE